MGPWQGGPGGLAGLGMRLPQRTGAGGGNKVVPESQAMSVVCHEYVVNVVARKLLFYFIYFFKQVELLKLFIYFYFLATLYDI